MTDRPHTGIISIFIKAILLMVIFALLLSCQHTERTSGGVLTINDSSYFATRGLNVMVFSNWYNGLFSDSKMSGVEIIHHGVRTATNGDVRLDPTPEQWDAIPQFVERKIDREHNRITASLRYPDYHVDYTVSAVAQGEKIIVTVTLPQPLPPELEGKAGFNLEFLPTAYFGKAFFMDGKSYVFPRYPSGDMESNKEGKTNPLPLAMGKKLELAPEDPERHVSILSADEDMMLYDGRNKAQNGWYVVRSLIPAGKSGDVITWTITANVISDWTRKPVIAHSQVGYHPSQKKIAVIELDKNDRPFTTAVLLQVTEQGELLEAFVDEARSWGDYLRYHYLTFDFSTWKEEGIYMIDYGNVRTKPFRIAGNVFDDAWQPTMDVFFPVQMDHMFVNEAYRVWHGASHFDDALQAPVNHEHFDLYAQGPTTDTPYKPGEHIPGLNVGGWYDAGDFDIRTQTQYHAVLNLVHLWEDFKPQRDETTIDQHKRYVDIHHPDGKPDLLQQIEHGVLALISQHRAVGHAIPGIVESHLSQYTHLGDAVTKTDNHIFNKKLDSLTFTATHSGVFDDRWAFTSKSTPLNYGSAAALAAASRALRGYNDTLAEECFSTAMKVWNEEHVHPPYLFHSGNTTGGRLEDEELRAAAELLLCTKDKVYANRVEELWTSANKNFNGGISYVVSVLPYMPDAFVATLKEETKKWILTCDEYYKKNPFGVPVSTGGWAGNGQVISFAANNYYLHRAFPELVDKDYVVRGLNYIYGCHPGSDISFVSGVGSYSKEVAYGNNRADFSFIAGGVVPGVLILPPDFPENKEDWPFLWGENEYVISIGATYMYLVHAVNDMMESR